ncbi:MAG: serine hydrolase domain-containing protein [Acidimicrobiales bacterium]
MDVLETISDWPCANAAATAIMPDGTQHTFGDIDRRFALASVTKLLTATALLIGAEEGSVDLDATVANEDGTLSDLLAHASGLGPDGTRLDSPGRRRVYSNAGYEQAAEVLELAAEIPFADYLREAVFEPLRMTSTSLDGSPAHGATSTVGDLSRFLTGVDTLLAAETVSRMVTPHLAELSGVLPGYGRQAPNPWGLGPEIRGIKSPHWTSPRNSSATWGHFGQAGTFVWTDPAVQISLVVLTDHAFGNWALERWPDLSTAVLQSV